MAADAEVRDPTEAEVSLEDWIQRNQHYQDLAVSQGWALLCEEIVKQRTAIEKEVLSGSCKSMEAYVGSTAWIDAANFMLGFPAVMQANIQQIRAQMAEDFGKDEDDE